MMIRIPPLQRRTKTLRHPTHQTLPVQVRMPQAQPPLLSSDYQGNQEFQILNLLMKPLSGNAKLVMTQTSHINTICLPTSVKNASVRDHLRRNPKEQGQMRRLRTRSNVYAGNAGLVLLATTVVSIRNTKTTRSGTAPSARRTIRAIWTQAPYALQNLGAQIAGH